VADELAINTSTRGVQKIMGYSNHFVMAITSAEVKVWHTPTPQCP
jgi:hypothetical protein